MAAALFRRHYRVDLTPRQRQVLDLVAKGRTNFEIAQELGISLDGAKWHLRELFAKLGVESREEAAAWWRDYNAPKQRLARAARALFPAALGKWLIGATASVAVVVGLVVAVVVAQGNGGNGDEQATATTTVTATSTPHPSATPTASTILGLPVQQWGVGPAADLPDNVVVIVEHGCTQCDGPTSSLERISGGSASDGGSRTLFPVPGLDSKYIDAYAISPSGGEFYVTVCSRGYCGGIADVSPDAQTTIYHSTDGGITWQTDNSYGPPSSVSLGSSGWVLTTQQFDGTQYSYSSFPYPDATTAPASNVPVVPDGFKAALARQFDEQTGILPVSVAPGGDTIVQWIEAAGDKRTWFVGRLHDGALQSVITAPGSISIGGWISNTVAVGNYFLPASDSRDSNVALFARPALFDFDDAIVTPLTIGDGQEANPRAPDRDRIVNVQFGPFALVHTSGDCLNVRESASTSAQSLGCFADGVLLRLGGEEKQADGQKWHAVTTPMGKDGWASEAFLTR